MKEKRMSFKEFVVGDSPTWIMFFPIYYPFYFIFLFEYWRYRKTGEIPRFSRDGI